MNEKRNRDDYTKSGGYEEEYVPTDEDFEDEGPPPEGPLSRFPAKRHLAPALLMLLLFYAASAMLDDGPLGSLLWVSGESLNGRGEYWRAFTALFTHADMVHLLSNAVMFIIFGWMLRAYYGIIVFPLISLVVGAITNWIAVSIYPPDVRLMGASGMIYGMAAIWLLLYLRHDTGHYLPVRMFRALGFTMVMLIPSALEPHVSYLAHGVGFLCGLLVGAVLLPFVSVRDPS